MIRFELRHIRAFIVLAEELHYRRAAERLFMTQPGLSRMIRRLEDEVGAQLFLRTTRSVMLTKAGEVFLEQCDAVFEGLERGVMRARGAAAGDVGHMTVAYMDFIINGPLPRILEPFRREYPNVRIDLTYMTTVSQKEALLAGRIDVGLLIGPFRSSNICTLSLVREPLVALVSDEHRLAERDSVTLADLADEPFVLGTKTGWVAFRRIVSDLCHRSGFSPNVVQEASTSDGIFGLVAANMGVSLYASCATNIRRQGLTVKPLAGDNVCVESVAAWRSDTSSPSVWRFVDSLRVFAAEQ